MEGVLVRTSDSVLAGYHAGAIVVVINAFQISQRLSLNFEFESVTFLGCNVRSFAVVNVSFKHSQ